MKQRIFIALCSLVGVMACNDNKNISVPDTPDVNTATATGATEKNSEKIADAATIMAMPQIPVLCYHHIRNQNETYSVSPQNFAAQMKLLRDSGYYTVLPEDLYNYLALGKPLPEKPVMLTFDDTVLDQYTVGYTEMKKYDFKGVFFIMTISIGKPRYMNRDMLKELANEGNAVECHTWDHHRVTKYTTADWDKQLTEANATIESITGKKIQYFAYPLGLWEDSSIGPLKERNIKMAFQLSTKRDSLEPLYTVRRMIVPNNWSADGMLKAMKSTFSK